MRRCFLGLLLVTMLLAMSCLAATANELSGFRGMRWGRDIGDFKDMKFFDEAYGFRYYRKLNDKMSIGDTSLNDILYVFWQNKFSGVVLTSKGQRNARLLYETLKSSYGVPYRLAGDNFYWRFTHMWIFYNYNEYSHQLEVSYLTDDAVMQGGAPTPYFQRVD